MFQIKLSIFILYVTESVKSVLYMANYIQCFISYLTDFHLFLLVKY